MAQKLVTKESKDLYVFDQLFTEAFPPSERLLPSMLVNYEYLTLNGFYENGKAVGMMVTIDFPEFVYVLFLATFAEYRGQGIGSKIINTYYANNPEAFTIGSIEKPDDASENNAQRLARQKFYERLGYSVHDTGLNFNGVDFLLIGKGKGSDNKAVVENYFGAGIAKFSELKKAFGQAE